MNTYSIDKLVTVAKRDNNPKRPYLYVNPIQGKHIPVMPSKTVNLFEYMGALLVERYPDEQILVIGFAETATAVGAGVACSAQNVKWCMQTTREKYEDAEYIYFTESHSHATEQSIIINGLSDVLEEADRVAFAEDEITTGNTIVKLIDSIKSRFPNISVGYSILSILNSMTEDRIKELKKQGIECLYVDKIPFEYKIDSIDQYDYFAADDQICEDGNAYEKIKVSCMNLRYVHERYEYKEAIKKYVNEVVSKYELKNEHKILVLGTEEFMFPPLMVAKRIEELFPDKEIRFHATTRSPILVSESCGYPLNKRNKLLSFYEDDRTTYVYNLSDYDVAIILTDSNCVSDKSAKSICGAIHKSGCKRIIMGKE